MEFRADYCWQDVYELKGRYRNRVEFRAGNTSLAQETEESRYRNRVEFRVIYNGYQSFCVVR